jgi:hypothetical protein
MGSRSEEQGTRSERSRVVRRTAVAALLGLGVFVGVRSGEARPGTHPVVVSTWDARASSVLLQYHHGFLTDGSLNTISYNANFSATSGKLSAQFGFHYQNLVEGGEATLHGLTGSGTAVFNLPLTRRFDNGLSMVALGMYVGTAPTILASGARNFLSIPFLIGVGVPVTPVKALSITPWFELSPGFNLDTVINSFEFVPEDLEDFIDPVTGEVNLTEDDVQRIVTDAVELETSVTAGARAGLDLALHVSDSFDIAANVTISSLGSAFKGRTVTYLGGGFTWRWDDIVPAVLPADRRLLREDCADIEARYKLCPKSRPIAPPPEPITHPPLSPLPPLPPPASTVPGPAPAPAPTPETAPAPAAPPPLTPVPAPAPAPVTPPATGTPVPSTGTFPP